VTLQFLKESLHQFYLQLSLRPFLPWLVDMTFMYLLIRMMKISLLLVLLQRMLLMCRLRKNLKLRTDDLHLQTWLKNILRPQSENKIKCRAKIPYQVCHLSKLMLMILFCNELINY
jgi:hypothetical protein